VNLEGARIVLRPRTPSEIFDLAFRFCAALALPLYLRLAVIVLLPCLAVCAYVHAITDGEWALVWTCAIALAAFAQSVFTVAASRLLFAAKPGVLSILGHSLRRLPALLGALIIHGLLLCVGLFVGIGSFFFWVWHTFMYEAILLEQQGPISALRRASALIKHKFGAALVTCTASTVVVALGIVSGELLLGGLVEWVLQLGKPFGDLWEDGGSAYALVGFFAALPLVATARFLAYIDGRTRQDGWDIQLRFMAIAAAAEETTQ
jgi:hypothetical protein